MKSTIKSSSSLQRSHSQMGSSNYNNNIFLNNLATTNKPSKPSQLNLYATHGSLIKEFITQKNNFLDESSEKRPAVFNRYGFVAALVDGFTTDGTKRLEIALPDSADLSIIQNCGFSVFFWVLIKQQPGGVHRFIVKRGNAVDELTPSIGVLPNGTHLFIKIMSSKHRIETLLSNKKIEANRLYSLAVTFSIDYNEQLTDISLYLDGLLDSQISVPGEPLHNQGSLWVGKPDRTSYGFIGCIADIILVPRVLGPEEILEITQEGLRNISLTNGRFIKTYDIVTKKFERMVLIEKYIKHTETPVHVIENLELTNDELREIVKQFDEDIQKQEQEQGLGQEKSNETINEEENMIKLLTNYTQSEDSDTSIAIKKLTMNVMFIYTVLLLANKSEDSMEANRIVTIFEILSETLHMSIDKKLILKLAEIFQAIVPGTKSEIILQKFFKTLKKISENMFDDLKYSNSIRDNKSPLSENEFLEKRNSIELHENLLLNSQIFKNYIDDDIERDLGKSSFVIKSLYTKPKTGTMRKSHEEGDMVNQFDEMMIPEKEEIKKANRQNTVHEKLMQEGYDSTTCRGNQNRPELFNEPCDSNLKEGRKQEGEQRNEEQEQAKKKVIIIEEKKEEVAKDEHMHTKEKEEEMLKQKVEEHKVEDTEKIKVPLVYESNTHPLEPLVERSDHVDQQILPNVQSKESTSIVQSEKENQQSSVLPQVNPQNPPQLSKQPSNTNTNNQIQNPSPANALLLNPPSHNLEVTTKEEAKTLPTPSQGVLGDLTKRMSFEQPKTDENSKMFMDPQNALKEPHTEEEAIVVSESQKNDIEPKYPQNWNEGEFEIIINHCYDCHTHKTTTRHFEHSFVSKYNEIGESIRQFFPNAFISGNYEDLEYLGSFDVYLRGVGPRLDDKGRFFIYRKLLTKNFPTSKEITDKLIALSMIYGSSVNMESAQKQYLKAYSSSIPGKSTHSHDFPGYLNETAEKIKEDYEKSKIKPPSDDPERTKLSCMNWGCTAVFVKVENGPDRCLYHPGVWQFGSYQGYWPEAWSCCEKGWDDEGCTRGSHYGVRLDKRIYLCINHGEVNPRTHHPNSACGKYYTIKEDTTCKYHPGSITADGTWSCCRAEKKVIEGCIEAKHTTAAWPNEKAKLYFYPKEIRNPGLKYGRDTQISHPLSVSIKICRCDFFKPIVKAYDNPATKLAILKMKREKEKDEPRYCMNWTCESIYKEPENHDKACRCHPGKWDHGSTGTKMKEFIYEMNLDPKQLEKVTILWKPHWTCCRKGWNEPGCKKKRHRGPLLSDIDTYGKKFKWPDIRLKLTFSKVVSDKWKEFIQQYSYSQEKVKYMCKEFFSGGKKSLSELPELCDSLRLYLLVVNENVEYQMKFMDIATQSGTVNYFLLKDGSVDPDRFLKWWFGNYEKIVEELNPPVVENPPKAINQEVKK